MPRIAEETIQRVAEANDIVEVIGAYFPLKRAGTSWRAICPFHREKTPSFHVNPQRQSYHCFGCGAGGSVIRFVMEYEHLDFVSSVRKLAQRANIPVIEEAGSAGEDSRHELRKRLLALHAEASAWFHHNLLKTPDAQLARDYLKSRAITGEIAKSWQLGYAPDSWDDLPDMLKSKGFSVDEILQSGLTNTKDEETSRPQAPRYYARFRDRIMFPIRNDYGEVIAFSGRVLDPEAKTAKYVNSPETAIFIKGRVLYGLDKSKRALIDQKTAIVCEGQLDLISAFESGVENVIAPQGTAFTAEQARILLRFVETVVLCFDSDRAGQEAVTRSLPALLENGLEVKVARLPEGEDPDSLIRGKGPDAFREVVDSSKNFFDHALDILAQRGTLNDPAGQAAAAKRLGPYVALIKDRALKETTAKKICARLGISDAALAQHLKAAPTHGERNETSETARETVPLDLDKGLYHLCRLSLTSAESREWLQNQPRLLAAEVPGADFLNKILESPLALEQPGARVAFSAGLTPEEEATLNSIDLDRVPPNSLQVTKDNWNGIHSQIITNQIDISKSKQGDRNLASQEQAKIQTKVLQAKLKSAQAQLENPDETLTSEQRAGLREVVEMLSKQILDLQSRLNEV